ncbi:MAG: 2,3-bisphosphoglycerate-independent phosphoglycerate mutase [Candidatus Peribacteraceae bacterium]|nr:2,3-bisphosphoglycerate-independent phosphoglycerate mutase [Candidatus Peribacteraceae bacterium]
MSKVCLIIIDGFGVAPAGPGNARSLANLPNITKLEQEVPNVIIEASGNAVGLPKGQQGASEPGHLTIGAGRIVWQPLEEINREISSGKFFENDVYVKACKRAVERGVPVHLFGIYSYGGVHGHMEHMHTLAILAEKQGVEDIYLHLIGDGRDVPKKQFCDDYEKLQAFLKDHLKVKAVSLIGRYYGMDRDKQYKDRTKLAYDLYTQGKGEEVDNLCEGAKAWHKKAPEKQKTDYYIKPIKTSDFVSIKEEDAVIGVNFRIDRMFQIVDALEKEDFSEFNRPVRIKDIVCTGPYSDHLPIAYPAPKLKNTLTEVVTNEGKNVLKIAETDKWAHTTFFFNGQRDEAFRGEDRIMIDSPKVPNFASTPEMSADELTDKLIEKVEEEKYELIVVNFANPDLVGHGANIEAAVIACETVDRNIGRLLPVLSSHNYEWIVTADHGNIEDMLLPDGKVSPSHTANPVQTFVKSSIIKSDDDLRECKGLKDIAPLILGMMEIDIPEEMKSIKQ